MIKAIVRFYKLVYLQYYLLVKLNCQILNFCLHKLNKLAIFFT